MSMSALLSPCGRYRYWLTRNLTDTTMTADNTLVIVMLNPSTADDTEDDPTIRRCKNFALSEGYAHLTVMNLFAYRATDPTELHKTDDPVGPENDKWIGVVLSQHQGKSIAVAWGAKAPTSRVRQFMRLAEKYQVTLQCWEVTKQGEPRHPLYLDSSCRLRPWLGLRRFTYPVSKR